MTRFLLAILAVAPAGLAYAEQHTAGVPALSSRPGAPYTIYLNVAGFNYDGDWRESGTPGFTPSVGNVPAGGTFTAGQQAEIRNIWSRMAQSYVGFNVNVTTVDPAVAAGQAGTDAARQAYYDATPNLMHTVIGSQVRAGNVKWYSNSADGVSALGVVAGRTDGTDSVPGDHTNWMFTEAQQGPGFINGDYIGAVAAHENGHAFGLNHQGDWTGNTNVNEYSNGDANPGNGSYVPILGNASGRQRVAWRLGDTNSGNDVRATVNDIGAMLRINTAATAAALGRTGAADLHLIDDGIGHTRATATTLSLIGDVVNPALARGVIVPLSEDDPDPIGTGNYTRDWFSFYTDGGDAISLTATDGTSFLAAGVADGVGTLRSVLSIFDSTGALVGTGVEDDSTLFETYTSLLPAGTYYAEVSSFGGHIQDSPDFNAANYFDTGAFFLTGSGFDVVPEPGTVGLLAAGGVTLLLRRRRGG